jgi:hypothetical protein
MKHITVTTFLSYKNQGTKNRHYKDGTMNNKINATDSLSVFYFNFLYQSIYTGRLKINTKDYYTEAMFRVNTPIYWLCLAKNLFSKKNKKLQITK